MTPGSTYHSCDHSSTVTYNGSIAVNPFSDLSDTCIVLTAKPNALGLVSRYYLTQSSMHPWKATSCLPIKIPISQMKKLKTSKCKQPVQWHAVTEWTQLPCCPPRTRLTHLRGPARSLLEARC